MIIISLCCKGKTLSLIELISISIILSITITINTS